MTDFNQWFAQRWAGEDDVPVPSTGDWTAYGIYESARANALAGWNARQAEIDALKEQLQPYLDADVASERQRQRDEKIEEIVNLCAPKYDSRHARQTGVYPVRHPKVEKLGWWNGASIKSSNELINGDVEVELESYVGCSQYEDLTLRIPSEWITAVDTEETVHTWCKQESARLAAVKTLAERRQKEAQLEQLKKELKQ